MAKSILSFKSNLPNLTVLKINSQDIVQLKENVRKKIRQAPMMFIGMQVVIDLSDFDTESVLSLELKEFTEFLKGESINPIAVMSNNYKTHQLAVECKIGALPILSLTNNPAGLVDVGDEVELIEDTVVTETNHVDQVSSLSEKKMIEILLDEPRKTFDESGVNSEQKNVTSLQKDHKEPTPSQSKTINHSIRSGQSIYAQGDLTVIGSVSPGAEVIADGNIHIYGTLRGRAIAGAHGDTKASIFCQKLEAELVAISGNYTHMEDANNDYLGKTVQISLENEKIYFFPL